MKASVIIPTYNREEILRLTLLSLTKQSIARDDYEVIVVDDGSQDKTAELVDSFKASIQLKYYYQEDLGYRVALARNEGIKRSVGKKLIFLDSGMVVPSTFIEEHIKAHDDIYKGTNSQTKKHYAVIGYVFGYALFKDFEHLKDKINFEEPDQSIEILRYEDSSADYRNQLYIRIDDDLSKLAFPWPLFWTTNVSVSRALTLEIGCFDENFITWGMEDLEFAYRLAEHQVIFKLARNACGIHYPHERNRNILITNQDNKLYFFRKYPNLQTEIYKFTAAMEFNNAYQNFLDIKRNREKTLSQDSSIIDPDAILKAFFQYEKMLIIGCEDGFLLSLFHNPIGLEADMLLLQKAKELYPNMQLYNGLGIQTIFASNSFDAILITGWLLALPQKFIDNILQEASRLSKNVYIFTDINIKQWEHLTICQNIPAGGEYMLYKITPSPKE
jgi:glycosyltransferase involved in cell wall biosynthesis